MRSIKVCISEIGHLHAAPVKMRRVRSHFSCILFDGGSGTEQRITVAARI